MYQFMYLSTACAISFGVWQNCRIRGEGYSKVWTNPSVDYDVDLDLKNNLRHFFYDSKTSK